MTAHLWDRLAEARERLAPVQSRYRIVFEDPAEPAAAAKVLVPDPNWLAAALAGGILPPVDTYLRDAQRVDNEPKEHPYAEPIGPVTEEEAILYLIMKDVPSRVWRDYTGNRVILRIVPVEAVPADRTWRDAWAVSQKLEGAIAA